ncbi:hypothetical protein D9M69_571950 [compost metagenome]
MLAVRLALHAFQQRLALRAVQAAQRFQVADAQLQDDAPALVQPPRVIQPRRAITRIRRFETQQRPTVLSQRQRQARRRIAQALAGSCVPQRGIGLGQLDEPGLQAGNVGRFPRRHAGFDRPRQHDCHPVVVAEPAEVFDLRLRDVAGVGVAALLLQQVEQQHRGVKNLVAVAIEARRLQRRPRRVGGGGPGGVADLAAGRLHVPHEG